MSPTLVRSVLPALLALATLDRTTAAQAAGPLHFASPVQIDAAGTAQFASSMSLSGDDLLVRATEGAFVFHRAAGAWSTQAFFSVPYGLGLSGTFRSTDVSIAGDRLVIGEPSSSIFGKAWISERTGSTWSTPTAVLDDSQNYYQFGQSVLVYAGLVLVGVPDDPFPGSFWIWRTTPAGWQLQTRIHAPGAGHWGLGVLMATEGTTLLVAERDAVDVFVQGATSLAWNHQALLDPAGSAPIRSLAIDGDVAVVAADGGPGVLVYERSGSTWSPATTLPVAAGLAVAVADETIYVGVAGSPGTVHVFQRSLAGWSETAILSSAFGASTFGRSLATDGTTLCVGAPSASNGTIEVFDVVSLPAPQSYCTAKVNSQGCLPAIGSVGQAGATNAQPFAIGTSNVINQKTGLLLYTTAGAATTPFQGGTLCLASPLRRTPAQSSGGQVGPDDCSGSYSFDFNGWVQSGVDPSLAPGVSVWAQYYSRDPADPFQVGLSDALVFVLGS